MNIYTMGFTQKNAEQFFGIIRENEIEMLIDVRLNNQSQLAGFTKGKDIVYFLKELCNCNYDHNIAYAPTKEILQQYKKNNISWEEYEKRYNNLIKSREIESSFKSKYSQYTRVLLLCSEATPEHCHRRLLAEYLQKELGCSIIHV
ncbi:DUF488 domain-containing protein [Roseburia hominis]|uniref:DUF488 domain-containing protein n=1 Tax=Roseburia hominis TaxID=301301 RepID=UPI001F267FCD|nr:DUF488 domain-containing protein [Roseburia hominis]